jgi:hypothetical protein
MTHKERVLSFASVLALSLSLGSAAVAEEAKQAAEPAAAPEQAPAEAAPASQRPEASTVESMEAMRAEMQQRYEAAMAERAKRIEEMRAQAEQRRQEMLERYEAYRATIEAMSDEQKEAIAALFGGANQPESRPMPPMGPGRGQQPWGGHGYGYPGYGAHHGGHHGMHPKCDNMGSGCGRMHQMPPMMMRDMPEMPAMPEQPAAPSVGPAASAD